MWYLGVYTCESVFIWCGCIWCVWGVSKYGRGWIVLTSFPYLNKPNTDVDVSVCDYV